MYNDIWNEEYGAVDIFSAFNGLGELLYEIHEKK